METTRTTVYLDSQTLNDLRIFVAEESKRRGKRYSMADFINEATREKLETVKKNLNS